mmetsp:Transcript_2523/g.3007  ORF Transcript_2523/g.3007 Transcript_2523/m.3007 type:complete len:81 (-) Transcript_2523:308-550(-)
MAVVPKIITNKTALTGGAKVISLFKQVSGLKLGKVVKETVLKNNSKTFMFGGGNNNLSSTSLSSTLRQPFFVEKKFVQKI